MSSNIVDPDLGNDITDEALVTLEHELRPNFSVSATYIYKVIHDQQTTFNQGVSSGDYLPIEFTRACGNTSCDAPSYTATYYRLPYQLPTPLLLPPPPKLRKAMNPTKATTRAMATIRIAGLTGFFSSMVVPAYQLLA